MADLDKILNRFAALVLAENGGYKNNGLAETKQAINQLCLSEFLELLPSEEELAKQLYDKLGFENKVNYATKTLAEDTASIVVADLRTKALEKWGRNE